MAASRLSILDAAPSLDDLPPLLMPAPNLVPVPLDHLLRELIARAPFEAAAQRFIDPPPLVAGQPRAAAHQETEPCRKP